MNYRFKDLGNTTEVVTYQGEKCEDAVKFIFSNQKERIKVEYTGGKPYVLYIADADKKAITSTYELAVVLSDIEKLTKEKEKSIKKLTYLKRNFQGNKRLKLSSKSLSSPIYKQILKRSAPQKFFIEFWGALLLKQDSQKKTFIIINSLHFSIIALISNGFCISI